MPSSKSTCVQHLLKVSGHEIPYTLRRSERRSLGLQIGDSGLLVFAPQRLALRTIEASLQTKASWICKQLEKWRAAQTHRLSLEEVVGKARPVPVLGLDYAVVYGPHHKQASIDHSLRQLVINDSPPSQNASGDQIQVRAKRIERLLRPLALQTFTELANLLKLRTPLPAFSLHLSSAKSRWGSCNKNNQIRLNWRLVFYPRPIIEYVVAHELAHLLEMNHSPAFWGVVKQLKPDFQPAHQFLAGMHPEKVPIL